MLASAVVGCDDDAAVDEPTTDVTPDEPDPDEPDPDEPEAVNITISDVSATYNTVTFTVVAEDANAIAYICREVGSDDLTAQEVFTMGEPAGVSEGTFTARDLKSSTDYLLCVALQGADGFKGPVTAEFTTEENTGAASSSEAAGIRVDTISDSSLIWEVANGADVDFSLTMVQPTVTMENYCLEAAKSGLSSEDAIKDFMVTYGYLCQAVMYGETVQKVNYGELYSDVYLFPGGNYTIYTLGFSGDYTDETSFVPLELSHLDVQIYEKARVGSPDVDVSFSEIGITFLRNLVTPNADAIYWGSLFTQTAELEEFKAYFDAKEGAGAGVKRLKEYIQYYDISITEQTGQMEYSTTVGFDQHGIDFSNVAVGFDANLVAGDYYREAKSQVLEPSGDDAEFSMEVHDVGAGNFYLTTTLEGNCMQAYWKIVAAGSLDDTLADEEAARDLAFTLWNEAWAVWRWNQPNENQDVVLTQTEFHYGENYNTTFDMVATGLNYGGSLTLPRKVATFTTLSTSKGDFEPSINVSVSSISKTNAIIEYDVDKEAADASGERLFYHRIILAEEVENYTDDQYYDWLMASEAANANIWPLVNSETTDEDPYNYSFSWAGLEPNTSYIHFWTTENGQGEISKVGKLEFTTLSNDGGDNPAFTINVNPESITETAGSPTKFTASATVTPNNDVVSFLHVFVEESVLESWWYDPDDEEELGLGLYTLLSGEGVPSSDASTLTNTSLTKSGRVWIVAQGQGANGIESKLSYVCFDSDGNIGEQVDVDITPYITSSVAAKQSPIAELSVDKVVSKTLVHYYGSQISGVKSPKVRIPAPMTEAGELDGVALRKMGVPYYSIKEYTLMTLLRGAEPKK